MINEFNTNVYGCYCLVFVNGQTTDTAHSAEKHIDANSNILQSYAAVLCIFILYSWENTFVNQKEILGLYQILYGANSIGNSHPSSKLKVLTTAAFRC